MDLSKGVLPIGLVIAMVLGVVAGVYKAGRWAEKMSQFEAKAAEAPTADDLDKLSKAIVDLDQRIVELRQSSADVAAIKVWMVAVYERASAHGWDLPPLPKGVQDEQPNQKKGV